MTRPAELRVGFVGAGTVAALQAAAIAEVDGLRLTTIVDPDEALAQQRRAEWGVRVAASLDDLIGDVDAVFVLTHTAAHADVAEAAIRAGRHVLIEKPVADDPKTIRRLAELPTRPDQVVVPGHNYLYLPEARRVVDQSRRGQLGTTRAMFVTYALAHPESLARRYGPVLEEVMVHHVYLALQVLGRPDHISAGAARPGWSELAVSDQAWITLEYDRGASAHLFASFAVDDLGADPQTFAVKVLGTQGTSGFTWRSTTHRPDSDGFSVGIPLYHETYVHQARAFRDAARGTEAPLTSLADAVVVGDVIAAARTAAARTAAARGAAP